MVFTIGDVVILLVVVAALALFRQLDKGNRSLEKVKRFAAKVQGDLDEFVDSKTQELKNLTIELDVHQKSAKEILRRIGGIETDIQERTKGVDEIRKRVEEYDVALSDLVSMTQKVDENLKRLHDESEFVDTVGKRVREAITAMGQIEKAIPSLRNEFARQNSDQLKAVSSEVVKATQELVDTVSEDVTRAGQMVKEFSDYLQRLEAKRAGMEAVTVASIQKRLDEYGRQADDARSRLTAQFENDLKSVVDREDERGQELIESIRTRQAQLKEHVEHTQELLAEKLETFQDRITRSEDEYQQILREVAEKGRSLEDEVFSQLKGHIEGRARSVESALAGALNETKERLEKSRKELVQMFGDTRSQVTVWRAELQKNVDEKTSEFLHKYEAFASQMETRLQTVLQDTGRTQQEQRAELESFVESTRSGIEDLEGLIRRRVEELERTIAAKEADFRRQLAEADDRGTRQATEFRENAEKRAVEMENLVSRRFGDLEKAVAEYEDGMSYRFGKIEEVSVDVGELEGNLRKNMERVAARVREEFGKALKAIAVERDDEKKKAEQQLAIIRDSMSTIDRELTELKSRAYENVSEKLQVFEDDFFADLQKRNDQVKERLESWQKEFQDRLDELAVEHASGRTKVERAYDDELRAKVADLQQRTVSEFERYGDQVRTFQDNLDERTSGAEETLKVFETNLRREIDETKSAARGQFEREFGEYASGVDERFRQHGKEVDAGLRILSDHLSEREGDLKGIVEAARSDVTVWQAKVLQQMQDAERSFGEEIDTLRASADEHIAGIREEFRGQKQELVDGSREDRRALTEELQTIAQRVTELSQDLGTTSRESIQELSRQTDSALDHFQERARAFQQEIDDRLREFRSSVQATREKVDAVQQKLYGKVEEHYRTLSVTLEEIDKKQRGFINQTKIFERADSLRQTLQEHIEELKSEISRVEEQGASLRDVEKEFARTRKLGEEVSEKLSRFLAEKRRIESMDGDFRRLISIAQTVDVKLEQVTSSHDALQEMQAKLRLLEDLEAEAAKKYERLESRKQVIEVTTASVDRNFRALEDLEGSIRAMEKQLAPLPDNLAKLEQRFGELTSGMPRAEKAIELLEKTDDVMKDLEGRMDALQKARDWLARTETRLEEINRQADDQVKLLGSLLKEGAKSGKKERGAPPMSSRDMVVRLAHQGWNVDQISKATGLSKGEVELILELQPKR